MTSARIVSPPVCFHESILDRLQVGLWSWRDAPTEIQYSSVTAALFGLPRMTPGRSGLSFERFKAALHPDDRERVGSLVTRTLQTGGAFTIEYRTMPAPDTIRWVVDRGKFELGSGGSVVAGYGMVVDVTDRVRGDAIERRAFQSKLSEAEAPIEVAVNHVLALRMLVEDGVVPGKQGDFLAVILDEILLMLGRELASQLTRSGDGFPWPPPSRPLH